MSDSAPSASSFSWWSVTKQAGADWVEDKATKLAAALAFYTMLSIGPLLIFSLKVVSVVYRDKPDQQIENYLSSVVGSKAATAAADMIKNQPPSSGMLATVVGVVVLLFSASGVFGELQDSLNTIWEVKAKPDQGIMATVRQRFFSFTLVLGVAFLLLVSLVISAVLSGVAGYVGGGGIVWQLVNQVVSLAVITGLFALIFRYLPDVRNQWPSIWVGATLTAVLFTIGKYLLGLYLGRGSTTSVYGAAGSLVALLLWVYYAAQILFFGAEFTQAYARATGEDAPPMKNAVYITEEDRAQRGIASPQRIARKVTESERPAPPRIIRVPVPQSHDGQRAKAIALAGAGLVVGAVAGVFGTINAKKDPRRASQLNERFRAIESKVGRVSRLKEYLDGLSVSDRIDRVERQVRETETKNARLRVG